eukprot:evm.model.scf_680.3 EVM.evm.TU.scf_680.3   scf_680:23232-27766(-)
MAYNKALPMLLVDDDRRRAIHEVVILVQTGNPPILWYSSVNLGFLVLKGGSDDEDTAPEADDEEDEKRPGRAKGGNYDLDDEWIDDSDLVELYEARGHKLKYSGFYVHRGPLNMYTMDTAERPAKKRRASDSALVQKGRPSGAAKPKGTWKVATALTNQAKRHKAATKQPKARASSEAEKQGKQGGKMPPPPARKRKQSPTLQAGGKKTHSTKPESQPSTSNQPNEPSRCEPSSKPQPVPIVGSIAAMAVAAGACASARSIKPKPVGPRALQHAQQQSARHSIQAIATDQGSRGRHRRNAGVTEHIIFQLLCKISRQV